MQLWNTGRWKDSRQAQRPHWAGLLLEAEGKQALCYLPSLQHAALGRGKLSWGTEKGIKVRIRYSIPTSPPPPPAQDLSGCKGDRPYHSWKDLKGKENGGGVELLLLRLILLPMHCLLWSGCSLGLNQHQTSTKSSCWFLLRVDQCYTTNSWYLNFTNVTSSLWGEFIFRSIIS